MESLCRSPDTKQSINDYTKYVCRPSGTRKEEGRKVHRRKSETDEGVVKGWVIRKQFRNWPRRESVFCDVFGKEGKFVSRSISTLSERHGLNLALINLHEKKEATTAHRNSYVSILHAYLSKIQDYVR